MLAASIVAEYGFSCNFENGDTHYRNGIDSDIDWAASQFLSEQVHLGVVGYDVNVKGYWEFGERNRPAG